MRHDDPDDRAAALRHPLWWAALAVLLLNDHALKGAGVLPGWLTGKLSDVAGMLVAPALAASLIPLRARRLRAAAFLGVAALFAALKVLPDARDAFVTAAALLGVRARIALDPTDLVALAALPLGWRLTLPAPGPRREALRRGALLLGGLACVATTQDPGPAPAAFSARAWIVNRSGRSVDVGMRFLDGSADCAAARASSGLVFSRALFGDELLRVTVDDGEAFPLDPEAVRTVLARSDAGFTFPVTSGSCAAVLISATGLTESVAFWGTESPVTAVSASEFGDAGAAGSVALQRISGSLGALELRPRTAAVTVQAVSRDPATCDRRGGFFSWSGVWPSGGLTLRAVDEVPGGCLALDFEGATSPAFLCVPRAAFPFAPGASFTATAASTQTGGVLRLSGATAGLTVVSSERLDPARPSLAEVSGEVSFGVACGGHREDCGAYVLPRSVRVGAAATALPGGDGVVLPTGRTLFVGRADEVLATRASCGAPLSSAGTFIDYAITRGP